jgi:hypothetical protein
MQFKDLKVGQRFDFVSPNGHNSFYKLCTKISARKYQDEDGVNHTVGTIKCNVYNVSLTQQPGAAT